MSKQTEQTWGKGGTTMSEDNKEVVANCDICGKDMFEGDGAYVTSGGTVSTELEGVVMDGQGFYTTACEDCGNRCSDAISRVTSTGIAYPVSKEALDALKVAAEYIKQAQHDFNIVDDGTLAETMKIIAEGEPAPSVEQHYAESCWAIEDVHEHRAQCELPEWTDEQAREFLRKHEKDIVERAIEAGWNVIYNEITK